MKINEIIVEGIHDPYSNKAIFVAGPPGAGKNTVLRDMGLTGAGLKLIDADRVIAMLRRSHSDDEYGNAQQVMDKQRSLLQQQRLGLLINTTGRDFERTTAIKHELEQAGYDTFMLFVDAQQDIAWTRAQDRQRNATNPADQRAVTKDYFDQAYPDSVGNQAFYAAEFGDNYARVVNNEHRVVEDSDETYATTLLQAQKKIRRFLRSHLNRKG